MLTKIEWTDATWNPVTGCTKISAGCNNCYAERLWPKVEGARVKRGDVFQRVDDELPVGLVGALHCAGDTQEIRQSRAVEL